MSNLREKIGWQKYFKHFHNLVKLVTLMNNFFRSDNLAHVLIFSSCKSDMSTKTGQNINYLLDKHKMDSMAKLSAEKKNLKKLRVYTLPEEEKWKVSLMK